MPFPPGGSADTVIRPIAQKVADALKQPIVIDNRPGGGGNVAAVATKQAAPDGYTLFLTNMGVMSVNPILTPDLRFDPMKDFQPITPIISFPHILVVPADSPAKTIAELAAWAKTKPGGLSFGSQGSVPAGRSSARCSSRGRSADGARAVPRRRPRSHRDHGGRIDFLFTSYISVGEQAKAGKLRMIAVAGKKRTDAAPDLPTVAEAGFAGLDMDMWHGMVAPAGTPTAIVQRLNQEFTKAARGPDIVRMIAPQATELLLTAPGDFRKMIADDTERLGKIIRDAGIKGQ